MARASVSSVITGVRPVLQIVSASANAASIPAAIGVRRHRATRQAPLCADQGSRWRQQQLRLAAKRKHATWSRRTYIPPQQLDRAFASPKALHRRRTPRRRRRILLWYRYDGGNGRCGNRLAGSRFAAPSGRASRCANSARARRPRSVSSRLRRRRSVLAFPGVTEVARAWRPALPARSVPLCSTTPRGALPASRVRARRWVASRPRRHPARCPPERPIRGFRAQSSNFRTADGGSGSCGWASGSPSSTARETRGTRGQHQARRQFRVRLRRSSSGRPPRPQSAPRAKQAMERGGNPCPAQRRYDRGLWRQRQPPAWDRVSCRFHRPRGRTATCPAGPGARHILMETSVRSM